MQTLSSSPRRALLYFVAALVAMSLSGCYFTSLVGGQLSVLNSSIDVADAMRRTDLSMADKDKLRFVQEVKRYAEDELHLARTCNFSTYLPRKKEPLTYVVSASRKDALEPVTWTYPIVGTASYRGYFDLEDAEEKRDELLKEGYDVYLGAAGAYSTLGWFCDPILPTMLDRDEGQLATLIIHELVHATLYVKGETVFNESLADFVAHTAAPRFLDAKYGAGNAHTALLASSLLGDKAVDQAFTRLAERLRTLYAGNYPDVLRRRKTEFAQTRSEIATLCAQTGLNDNLCSPDAQLDNAIVLARLTYGSPEPFQRLFDSVDGSWIRFFSELRARYDPPEPWYPQ